jgi:hypothetical protein
MLSPQEASSAISSILAWQGTPTYSLFRLVSVCDVHWKRILDCNNFLTSIYYYFFDCCARDICACIIVSIRGCGKYFFVIWCLWWLRVWKLLIAAILAVWFEHFIHLGTLKQTSGHM